MLLEKWENNVAVSTNGSRQTTHMICCHGNDIFLHALSVNRVPFDDPPSITEGKGGKVTDYRINVCILQDLKLLHYKIIS